MEALKKTSKYPLDNPELRWVFVHPRTWSYHTIRDEDSYIFVDRLTAEYLTRNQIQLDWSRFRKNVQSASVSRVNGKEAKGLRKKGEYIKTLAEIITGTRGTRRRPKNSYHANDWTCKAFQTVYPKHTTVNHLTAVTKNIRDDSITNYMFDLPHISKTTPFKPMEEHTKTMEQITEEFQEKVNEIMHIDATDDSKLTPTTIALLALIALALITVWIT